VLELFGSAYPPLTVRRIEGRLVVEDNFDSAAAPGVRPGDIVFSVDGLDATTRYTEVRQYVSGSTPASRDARTSIFWLGGPDSSTATLVVGDLRGRRDTVRVPRRQRYLSLAFNPARGQPLRLLAGTVGYVDLSRLPVSGVDSMFERFASARALILDLRGYPQGTHGVIGARLAKSGAIAARILSPVVDAPDRGPELITPGAAATARSFTETSQYIVPDGRAPYAGRVYVLADERSISQSEQAALFYRTAARATLVGSNTAGADGNYTMFFVPGGEGFAFTGLAVLAPDGTPIQGVGLTPDVRVTPTIAGLRAGRDEVLDCAVRLATGASRTCGSGRPSSSVP
jgi:C-terminal processing protease CtpA/Prc